MSDKTTKTNTKKAMAEIVRSKGGRKSGDKSTLDSSTSTSSADVAPCVQIADLLAASAPKPPVAPTNSEIEPDQQGCRSPMQSSSEDDMDEEGLTTSNQLEQYEPQFCEVFDKMGPRDLTVGEQINFMTGVNILNVLREILDETNAEEKADDCLQADRAMIYKCPTTEQEVAEWDQNLASHCGACEEITQLRRVLIPRREWMRQWEGTADMHCNLLSALNKQHEALVDDCCPQESLISRSRTALELMVDKTMSLPREDRLRMLLHQMFLFRLPSDLKDLMATGSTDTGEKTPSYAAIAATSEQHIIRRQLLIPDNSDNLDEKSLMHWLKFLNDCVSSGQDPRVGSWSNDFKTYVNNRYGARENISDPVKRTLWQRRETKELIELFKSFLPHDNPLSRQKAVGRLPIAVFQDYLKASPLLIDFSSKEGVSEDNAFYAQSTRMQLKWEQMLKDGDVPSASLETSIAKDLWKHLKIQGAATLAKNSLLSNIQQECFPLRTFIATLEAIKTIIFAKFKLLRETYEFFPESTRGGGKRGLDKGYDTNPKRDKKQLSNPKSDPTSVAPVCEGCGWNQKPDPAKGLPMQFSCHRGDHKQGCSGSPQDDRRNKSSDPWKDSDVGRKWKGFGYASLPKDTTVVLSNAEARFQQYQKPAEAKAHPKPHGGKGGKGSYAFEISHCNDLMLSNELIPFSLLNNVVQAGEDSEEEPSGDWEIVDCAPAPTLLLDSGAIGSCVVSDDFLALLDKNSISYKCKDICHELKTAMNDNAVSHKEISFNICVKSEVVEMTKPLLLSIVAIVAPIGVDLIIDKLTIKKQDLVQHFPSHFAEGEMLEALKQVPLRSEEKADYIRPVLKRVTAYATTCSSQPIGIDVTSKWRKSLHQGAATHHHRWIHKQKANRFQQNDKVERSLQASTIVKTLQSATESTHVFSLVALMKSNFSNKPAYERDGNLIGIPDNKLESIPAELLSEVHSENDYKHVLIEGAPIVKAAISEFIEEFRDRFDTKVQQKPADLTPFKLEVDTTKWETPANQLRCRRIDREREVEFNKMIKILIDANIIEACDAAHYSHAFLVPKPNGKWRLVLDFKNLNNATVNYYKWPLPDIKEMLNRVGDSRPKFFAVFDLTSGYYQAEIDEDSRKFTAFLTRNGVYRWLRLPMGLTGAGSFFQKSLVTEVLKDLMHDGVELYMDDCMVHATTLDEYLKRLRQVFLRFREKGITLNPFKCKLGMSEAEFVGHTIDANGLHFTRDKLDSVLNFPRPETKRQIKSFIGLANYFRDHIQNHSIRAQPLQDFVGGYDKGQARQRIVWTEESNAAFEDLRDAIDQCPRLWFLDDHSEIFLQTDASDYGIGAYLYQLIEDEHGEMIELPIGFVSKSITSAHQSWDTPMKEGFAIFYALRKWEYLLRDRQFSIKTDHQNLTRLRADHDSNKMVKRWFMCYQEFDIKEWIYVKGSDNGVPDKFSRLCKEEEDIHPASMLFQLTGYEIPEEHWDTIAKVHNSGLKGLVPNAEGTGTHPGCPGGHGGVARTLLQLDEAGLQWKHRTKHVRRFIRMCPCCQKMDQMKKVIHSYPFTLSTYGLWNTISVDYIESLKPDEFGNNMIIVIIDNFSRFTDLYPCSSTNAEGAADALLSFCGRYATPLHFCTDSGSNFLSKLIAGLMERLGTDHFLTKAYSKETNGIVERQNKEILRHLRNIIFDKRIGTKWSKYTPLVQRVLNSSRNSATGLTPAEMVFPDGLQLDKSILTESSSIYVSSYIQDLQRAQGRILALAEMSLRSKDKKHMDTYSPERTVFEDGSYVLVEHRHNALRRGPVSKLLPFLKGPMLVKEHDGLTGDYVLQDLVTAQRLDYHVSRLRPFLYDERTCTPLQAAVTDTLDEFVAERVLRMRGNSRKTRKDLSFRIRWAGSAEADDTWEPWEYCKDSHAVQTFLRAHPEARIRRLAKPVVPVVQEIPSTAMDQAVTEENS